MGETSMTTATPWAFLDGEMARGLPDMTPQLWNSNSLRYWVVYFAHTFDETHRQIVAGTQPEWLGHDPMHMLQEIARLYAGIYPNLVEQGFTPPTVMAWEDPMVFLDRNAKFLKSVAPFVTDPAVTVN
jgi:hypothetical protein